MAEHAHGAAEVAPEEPAGVADRELGRGFLATAWPLLALAIMTLMLVRACIPIGIGPAIPAFDAASAARIANEQAAREIAAMSPDAEPEVIAKALNRIVVNFSSGSATIPADAQPVLARAAGLLARVSPMDKYEIGGHTDTTGTAEGNLKLSEQRARSVLAFLVKSGAPPEQLTVKGYGDQRPVGDNGTERGRFGNRRIEFTPLPCTCGKPS